MLELDEATRRALSQRYGPTPDAQARVLAELRTTLGGPVGPDGGVPPAGTGTGQGVWIAKICAATTGLTAAGLLVLKVGATVLGGEDVREPAPAPAKNEAPARVEPPPSNAPEIQADIEPESAAARPVAAPVQAPTKRSTESSTLAAELALLDAAKRILDSDPAAARVYLERHQKEFPSGVLAPERDALRAELGTGSDKSGD